MLHVTVNGETFKYEADKLLNTEAIALQRVTGMKIDQWTEKMQQGDVEAITGLIWLLYRREGRDTAWDDVEFDVFTLKVVDDEADSEPSDEAGPTAVPPGNAVASGT